MPLRCSIIALVLFLFASCERLEHNTEIVDVDPQGWTQPAEVLLEVSDTTSLFELDLAVRYSSELCGDSLELSIITTTPDSVSWNDPFTLYLSAESQEVGSCVSDIAYRRGVQWGSVGSYRVAIHPMHPYTGVSAVGITTRSTK